MMVTTVSESTLPSVFSPSVHKAPGPWSHVARGKELREVCLIPKVSRGVQLYRRSINKSILLRGEMELAVS